MSEDNLRRLRGERGMSRVIGIVLEGEEVTMELTIEPKGHPRTSYEYPLADAVREDTLRLFEKMGRILREEG